jgi:hypothetical protein
MTVTQAGRAAEIRNARRFVQAAGLIFYLLAAQGLLALGVGVQVFMSGGRAQDLLLPTAGALLAVSYLVVGFHLRRYRLWARNFAFAFAAVSLFAFPVGTALGTLIVLCIERANRAGIFPSRRRQVSRPAPALGFVEEDSRVLRFEPSPAGAD